LWAERLLDESEMAAETRASEIRAEIWAIERATTCLICSKQELPRVGIHLDDGRLLCGSFWRKLAEDRHAASKPA